jgi:hypothetical protein
MKRNVLFVAAFAAAMLAGTVDAEQPVTNDDESYYSFIYKCDGFRVSVDGHNIGTHTTYFNKDGDNVRNVAHHHLSETHRNVRTGRTVEFRGNYASTYDYATNTQTFTGAFLIANEPMNGTLLQEVGLVEFNNTTGEIRSAGRHDILNLPYDPFCAALSG